MNNDELNELLGNIPFEATEEHSTAAPTPQKPLPGQVILLPTPSGFTAHSTVRNGDVFFRFSEISFTKQSIECVMDIELKTDEGTFPNFSQRIDLRSASARKSLATDLNAAYGDKKAGFNWVLILNVAFNAVIEGIQKTQRPESLEKMAYEELPFLAAPFLQTNVSNLLFAQSEAGKTWFALRLAISLITGQDFLGFPMNAGSKILFLDYEDSKRTFANRLYNLCAGMGIPYKEVAPHIHYYKPIGSFRTNAEHLKTLVREEEYNLLIIDAGGDAAGGSPSDEEKVLDLFNALEETPCTKLILHHEPKYVQSEDAAFYGSMYWKARSRIAWRLQVENEDAGKKTIKATIQKRSNLGYVEPIYYTLNFDTLNLFGDGDPHISLAVRMAPLPKDELLKEEPLMDSIIELLQKNGSLNGSQLSKLTGKSTSRISRVMLEKPLADLVEKTPKWREIIYTLKNATNA